MISSYKLRTVAVFFMFLTLFSIGLIQLFCLQIKKNDFFNHLATRQYKLKITTYPERGLILDRNNIPLAVNKDSIAAFILPQQVKDKPKLEAFLQNHYPTVLQRWKKNPESKFLYLARKLSPDEQLFLENNNQAQDIHFLNEPNRFYPITGTESLTGITNIDNTGIFGIELQYNNILTGTPTVSELEKDARSGKFYFSKTTCNQGSPGSDIKMTIDSNLQFLVQEELNAQAEKFQTKEGAAIVMDPETGDILAMASYPTFDPHNTKNLNLSTTKNYGVTESYEFGSILKVFTALAALEEEVVEPDDLIDCQNTKSAIVDGRRINNWEAQGVISFQEVIMRSNNIGIAKVAKLLDTKLYDHYTRLGFGKKTGIPFPAEQSGFINPPEKWSHQSIISLSYGYEINTTLLQLVRAFSVFANGGKLIQPRLILSPEESSVCPIKIYSDQSIDYMNDILEKTTSKRGTAHYAAINGFITRGKTSTANLLENGTYNENKNLYGFVGSVTKGNYKRVIGVYLKESSQKNLYAATTAAPLFKKIVERLLIHSNILKEDTN